MQMPYFVSFVYKENIPLYPVNSSIQQKKELFYPWFGYEKQEFSQWSNPLFSGVAVISIEHFKHIL